MHQLQSQPISSKPVLLSQEGARLNLETLNEAPLEQTSATIHIHLLKKSTRRSNLQEAFAASNKLLIVCLLWVSENFRHKFAKTMIGFFISIEKNKKSILLCVGRIYSTVVVFRTLGINIVLAAHKLPYNLLIYLFI